MSISEQVKELREIAKNFSEWEYNRFYDTISRAAETIESLSAKLQAKEYCDGCPGADIIEIPCTEECKRRHFKAENMQRSAEDCGGKWIYCGDGENLPEIERDIILSTRSLDVYKGYRANTEGYFYAEGEGYILYENVLAWMPQPEPYHEP